MTAIALGLTGEVEKTVTQADTASAFGSGLVPVYATPALVGLMEGAAVQALGGQLAEGQTTVGGRIDVRHLAATPVGMQVRTRAELVEVSDRKLVFTIQAWDAVEQIGEATHERFIVDEARFMEKVRTKSQSIAPVEAEKYRATANLNVREGPASSFKAFGLLKKGAVIEPLGESDDGQWMKFLYEGKEGWSSRRYLSKLPYIPPEGEDFPWMAVAEAELGIYEIPGLENNPRVLEYLSATENLDAVSASKDETPWCSAFVNWCLEQTGYEGTKNALARSWLGWGEKIETPRRGCIVVFEREAIFGHVAFYLDETATEVRVLGGNQLNPGTDHFEVCEKSYPKANLLGYRIPK